VEAAGASAAAAWLDPSNDWIPAALFGCAEMLAPFARAARSVSPLEDRALRQAFRELLLAQSSDFAFILKSGTVAGYARSRVESHLSAFADLVGGVRSGAIDAQRLAALESAHPIFPGLNLATFRTGGGD
jgi:1,4-alpha-glucan branching enzyme